MAKLIAQDLQPMLEAPGEVWVPCGREELRRGAGEAHGVGVRHGDPGVGGRKPKGWRVSWKWNQECVRPANGMFEVW